MASSIFMYLSIIAKSEVGKNLASILTYLSAYKVLSIDVSESEEQSCKAVVTSSSCGDCCH